MATRKISAKAKQIRALSRQLSQYRKIAGEVYAQSFVNGVFADIRADNDKIGNGFAQSLSGVMKNGLDTSDKLIRVLGNDICPININYIKGLTLVLKGRGTRFAAAERANQRALAVIAHAS